MNTIEERTIGQTVADDYRTAQVFRSFGLDFCCGGNKTIEEACERKGVNAAEVQSALDLIGTEIDQELEYNSWPLNFLIDYIVNTHHWFVRMKVPEIEFYANKVARVHGDRNPELEEIRDLFLVLKEEILDHLDKEEQMLFPYINELTKADREGTGLAGESVADPVSRMESEHEAAGEIMETIRNLSHKFTPPKDACASYRVLFQNLEGFQQDLHKHVHLENNILFPKALRLERKLNDRS